MKVLALSDEVVERLYSLSASGHFKEVEFILGCGDLPYTYLENILTFLNVPLFYVPGNHDPNYNSDDSKSYVEGGSNLDLQIARHKKYLIGGFGGSVRYRPDGCQHRPQHVQAGQGNFGRCANLTQVVGRARP